VFFSTPSTPRCHSEKARDLTGDDRQARQDFIDVLDFRRILDTYEQRNSCELF